jgi:Fe-S-cluster containining protein
MINKEWQCDLSCNFNCCSNLYLLFKEFGTPSHQQMDLLVRENKIKAFKPLTDISLLRLRNEIEITNSGLLYYEIKINTEFNIHRFNGKTYIEINSMCNKLNGNKCAIYENRPTACKVNGCIIKDPKLNHFNLRYGIENSKI